MEKDALPPLLWLEYATPSDVPPLGEFIHVTRADLDLATKRFTMGAPSSGRALGAPYLVCHACGRLCYEHYKCLQCISYVLCPPCEGRDPVTFHPRGHVFAKIRAGNF